MTHISQVHALAKQLGDKLKQYQLLLATAESCTGGQLAQTITSIPGASAWFERGFITYSPPIETRNARCSSLDIAAAWRC